MEGCATVIRKGDRLGNHMIVRLRLPSGRDIFGFGTECVVSGDWSLGPTWCYFVPSEPSFLFDCGWRKWGGRNLLKMMEVAGLNVADIGCVVISHGHEDHDGGLAEIVEATGLPVRSHPAHALLSRFYPHEAPPGARGGFPASCWNCRMPTSFSEIYCVDYHRERAEVPMETIAGFGPLSDGISGYHIPGHSPDAIAVMVGEEAILVGDTILPDITPHPTCEANFIKTGSVLKPLGMRADELYGIKAYIRSLKKLHEIGERFPDILVLPAHRLHYLDRWNGISLKGRVEELLEHHVQRCSDFLAILGDGPKTAKEIALAHFEPRLLKGPGTAMAINEVLSHCELMAASGDVVPEDGKKIAATGTARFESFIDALPAWGDSL